ncbi:LPD7 domain-containing protein [Serratia marcescens]|uniref:LPD7 domain-containing protein n=1 Tax=Enterobacterales TaxID=91347 RepID=UPI0025A14D71|nr:MULTISPECIES: LPD7 domain-containing protein [Enterobacterales]MDQ9669719.1 LPD7 domain-containing protein [Serratia marcescens]
MAQHAQVADRRLWLAVPHEEKDEAVAAGGLASDGRPNISWSPDDKLWYAREGTALAGIRLWLPDTSARATGDADPRVEFADRLKEAGFILEGLPVMDGKWHRARVEEDKKGKSHREGGGAYKGFTDGHPAGIFVNYHRSSEKEVSRWRAQGGETDPLTRLHIRAATRQAQDDSERARQQAYAEKARAASQLYDQLAPATDSHPYLMRKGVSADPALRVTRNNRLVVPFYNQDGEFQSLQYIAEDGEKKLYSEAPKAGNFFITGGMPVNGQPILYAEGYATARSLTAATGFPVVMAIDAGNMRTIAEGFGQRFPDSPHFFMADMDLKKNDNKDDLYLAIQSSRFVPSDPGFYMDEEKLKEMKGLFMALQAADRVPDGHVVIPPFTEQEMKAGLSDFNDLHSARGLDSLKTVLAETPGLAAHLYHPETQTMTVPVEKQAPAQPFPEPVPAYDNVSQEGPDNTSADMESYEAMMAVEAAAAPEAASAPEAAAAPTFASLLKVTSAPAEPEVSADPAADDNLAPVKAKTTAENATTAANEPDETENAIVWGPRAPGEGNFTPETAPASTLIDTNALLQRITHEMQNNTVLYKLDGQPAFRDHGNRMTMETPDASKQDDMVMAALLTAMQHYGRRIQITGSETFQTKVIGLIASHGLDVQMRDPVQQAMLNEALKQQAADRPDVRDSINATPVMPADASVQTSPGKNAPGPAPAGEQPSPVPPGGTAEPPVKASEPAGQPPLATKAEDFKDGVKGRLLEHGRAHYQFNERNSMNYYVHLETREGVREVWGKELEQAINQSRVSEGQVVSLKFEGNKPVTVNQPVMKDGKIQGYEQITAHRNSWSMTPLVNPRVRPPATPTTGETLSAYDLHEYSKIQARLLRTVQAENVPPIAGQKNNLLWIRPDGRGTGDAGDPATVKLPAKDGQSTTPVVSAWRDDGQLALHLVKGHGPYLQGIAQINGQYQHVLASMTGNQSNASLIINAITPDGLKTVGYGQALNKVEGKPVARDAMAFRFAGETDTDKKLIGKLENPETLPRTIHARLGFDEPFRPDTDYPKSQPRAEHHHKAAPGAGRPG